MFPSVNNSGVSDVSSAHPGLTNVVSNVLLMSVNEVVSWNNLNENGKE